MKYDGWIDINNNIDIIKLQNSMEIVNKVGSVLTFTGLVRDTSIKSDKKVIGIEIETWEDKADEIMRKIANKIGNNNNLHGIRIVHLKGKMVIGADGTPSTIAKNLELYSGKPNTIGFSFQYQMELSNELIEQRIGNKITF